MLQKMYKYFFSFITIAFFAITLFISFTNTASAAGHKLTGWAWSDNIGWISMSCENTNTCSTSNYSVNISPSTGKLSGYAWSSNIGWVSFEETTGCPTKDPYTNGCQPTAVLDSGSSMGAAFPHILGWARAVSASSMTSGAWDGWISLSCYNTGTCSTSNYGIQLPNNGTNAPSSGSMTGYAWGSTVSGWISFSKVTVTPDNSSLTLSSDKSVVSFNGDTVTLTWDSPTNTAYTSCTGSGGGSDWNGARAYSGFPKSLTVGVPNDPTTFKITCTDGTKTDEATVTVDINYIWSLVLTANPSTILAGDSSRLTWSTDGDVPPNTACQATTNWTSKQATSGNDLINNIMDTVTLAYKCTPPSPDPEQTATAKVKVLKLVRFITDACFKPSSNAGPNISWSAPNATSCIITDPNGNDSVVGASGLQHFSGGAGTYTIECTGGSVSVSGSLTATQCNPDYTMIPVTSCSGKAGTLTDNSFQQIGSTNSYKAIVHVKSTSEQGFYNNLQYTFTKPGSWPSGVTSNWTNITVNQPLYAADLELTFSPKSALDSWLNTLPNKTASFTVGADVTPGGGNAKSATYTVCAPDGGSSKPIFIEQ